MKLAKGFVQKTLQKTQEAFGVDDTFQVPADQIAFEDETTCLIAKPNQKKETIKNLDTLFIFTHAGIELPERFSDKLRLDLPEETLVEAMFINRDAGTIFMINELAKLQRKEPDEQNFAIIFHKINRNVIDANRIRVHEQLPATPYKGMSLWKDGVDKNNISEELVDPFVFSARDFILQTTPKFIFHPHTYDTYSGDSKGSNGHDVHTGKRPTGMIFNAYAFDTEAFGKYSTQDWCDFELMKPDELPIVQNIQNKHLAKIDTLKEEPVCTIDFPYVSPRQLCGYLMHEYPKASELILEFRKDLFRNGKEQIVDSIIEIMQVMSDEQ